jgi:CubicO group peptidase (beta-lactamase class C family)
MRKRWSCRILLALSVLPAHCLAQTFLKQADSIRTIRGIPGMVYAVFTSDSILDAGATGYRKFKTKDSLRITDRFNIGTNTTAFTAFVAARMVENRKIKYTTKLIDLFPEFKKKALPVYQSITLGELLSSRTRIQPFTEFEDWEHIPEVPGNNIIAKRKAFTLYMLQRKPNMENFLTGKIVFSLAGYVMAASMLERVSGRAWEDLVTEYIKKPMKISINYSWPNMADPEAPAGHWTQGNSFHAEEPDTWLKLNPVLYPAQNINISLPDYVKFMQQSLAGLKGSSHYLSQAGFDYLYFGELDYAMGWNNGSLNDQSYAFHEGLSLIFDCRVSLIKEKNLAIIVMCNSGDRDGRGGVLNLSRMLESYYSRN